MKVYRGIFESVEVVTPTGGVVVAQGEPAPANVDPDTLGDSWVEEDPQISTTPTNPKKG